MEERSKNREKIKQECEVLFDNTDALLLLWATGVGKTINAINLQKKMDSRKTLVCVAEVAHKNNWKNQYIEHGFFELLSTTKFICYNSLEKHINEEYDLIILDEMHHVFSDLKIELLKKVTSKKMIGLSATISNEQLFFINNLYHNVSTHHITMEEAIDMDLLPKPKIIFVPLDLDNKVESEIIEFSRGNTKYKINCKFNQRNAYIFNKKTYPNLNLQIQCTQKQKYEYMQANYSWLSINRRSACRNYGLKMKNFLSYCKTNWIKFLSNKMKDKRFVCFCGSIEQANEVNKANTINNEVKNSLLILDKFNNKEINSLFPIKMGVEGLNFVDIDAVIISQIDSTARTSIQKAGRAFRGQNPEIYIMYFKGTKDEDYLKTLMESIPKKYIRYLEV